MLPKERVLQALRRHKPDRVPVGEIGVDYPVTEQALGTQRCIAPSGESTRPCGRVDAMSMSNPASAISSLSPGNSNGISSPFSLSLRATSRRASQIPGYLYLGRTDGRIMQFSPSQKVTPSAFAIRPCRWSCSRSALSRSTLRSLS